MRRMKTLGALLLGGALALAGCSGSDGSAGAPGTNGTNGNNGTNGANGATGQKLKLVIDGVTTANNTATLTFTVYPAANVCPGGTCDDTLAILGQKTLYAQQYSAATSGNGSFNKTGNNFSFGGIHFKGMTADGNGAQYTATKASPPFTVETSTSGYVYGYIATKGAVPAPATGHYSLPSSVASASKVYGTISYTSAANVAGCEKCHNSPYSKHGYRQAKVAGLPDFVSCKVCHPDDTAGEDGQWYVFADDPAAYDPDVWDTVKYAYKKNIMNDVHNSHAMEFNYPQSMSNCTTCHEGKLTSILDDSCFRPSVCKSCHPVTGPAVGTQTGRAPALLSIIPHSVGNLYTASETACSGCHVTGNTVTAPLFKDIHSGRNPRVFDSTGARYDAKYTTTVDAVSYDAASYVVTVDFTVSGVSTTAAGLGGSRAYVAYYGWDTKDFIGNTQLSLGQQTDKSKFKVVANLSAYADKIAAGQVKRVEVFLMPVIGQDPNVVTNSTTNLAVAAMGASQTVDVTKTNTDKTLGRPDKNGNPVWYKGIVDPNKCKKCHESLGTFWWHSPRNGSAGVVGCRVCHVPTSAAGYYEMQSRSIDSFLHGAHAMQLGEMGPGEFDPNNAITNVRWEKHVEGNFPNFAGLLNCEACHYPGTYDPPDQAKSMPSLLSALTAGLDRPLGAFDRQIVGPAARACGACHRAEAINELDGTKLAAFVAHTNDFGSTVDPTLSVTTTAEYIMGLIGAGPATAPIAGAQVERCMICHPTAGSEHQALFNIWANGIKQ